MVGYGRHRSRQQGTPQQSDRSAQASQGKEQHPAVGSPKCGTITRSTKEVRVICADCMELFVKAD